MKTAALMLFKTAAWLCFVYEGMANQPPQQRFFLFPVVRL